MGNGAEMLTGKYYVLLGLILSPTCRANLLSLSDFSCMPLKE
jgi:hypothetical protein